MVRKETSIEEFCLELEKCITKQNYNDAQNCIDTEKEEDESASTDLDSLAERLETESRMIFNLREKSVSLSRLKYTDYKS